MITTEEFSKVMRMARAESGQDQQETAKEIGISASSLCRLEKGKNIDQAGVFKCLFWLGIDVKEQLSNTWPV